jgi:cysteine desulfurase / selenocysteine lyase
MFSEKEIIQLRIDTPGCQKQIHFNNAGAALPPDIVHNAILEHLELEKKIGGYSAQLLVQDKLDEYYNAFAKLLNCNSQEIAYVENATRAWDMAFYSIPFNSGERILTAQSEYASNYLAYLQIKKRLGISIDVIPNDKNGQISIEALEDMIDDQVKVISITHVPTQSGLVNPAIEIGRLAKKYNILYLLDACQSVGQMPIDVKEIGCDILTGTGRKFLRGPRGTGFLYVKQKIIRLLEPPFVDLYAAEWVSKNKYKLREDAKRFENWESYIAGRIGLATAVKYALNIGLERIWQRVKYLADLLRDKVSNLPGVRVHDLGEIKCGIVTFTKESESATELYQRLKQHNIETSVSTRSSARLDLEDRGLDEILRASVHYYNTEDEITRFCDVVASNYP